MARFGGRGGRGKHDSTRAAPTAAGSKKEHKNTKASTSTKSTGTAGVKRGSKAVEQDSSLPLTRLHAKRGHGAGVGQGLPLGRRSRRPPRGSVESLDKDYYYDEDDEDGDDDLMYGIDEEIFSEDEGDYSLEDDIFFELKDNAARKKNKRGLEKDDTLMATKKKESLASRRTFLGISSPFGGGRGDSDEEDRDDGGVGVGVRSHGENVEGGGITPTAPLVKRLVVTNSRFVFLSLISRYFGND